MARWLPPPPPEASPSFAHHALLLSLLAACVAATVVVVSSMCSSCHGKPQADDDDEPPSTSNKSAAAKHTPEANSVESIKLDEDGRSDEGKTVIEISPEFATHGPIPPVALPASASRRKLTINLSMRMSISDKMRASRRERKEKVESEETLWKKAIILGEKCKVPGNNYNDFDGDDEGGEGSSGSLQHRDCHTVTPTSRPMSRTSSFANPDAASS